MGKKATRRRAAGTPRDRRRGPRRRRPRALPVRLGPSLQGLPRPGCRRRRPRPSSRRPFEGLRGRVRLGGDARDRAGRDRRADASPTRRGPEVTWPPCCRWPGPGWSARTASGFVGLQVPGGSGDASRDVAHALELVLDAEPGTPDRPDRPARPRRPAAGPARPRRAARGRGARAGSTSGSTTSRTAAPRWSPRWSGPTRPSCRPSG